MSDKRYQDWTIAEYLEVLSSKQATVGGGTVAALNGALAASLVSMVATLTLGKKKYEEVQLMMDGILKQANELNEQFRQLMDQDTAAFEQVMAAYRVDKEDPRRPMMIEAAYKKASEVPLEVAKCAIRIGYLSADVTQYGNVNAKSDGLVGAMNAYTAAKSALWNVKINLDQISDTAFLSAMLTQIEALSKENESLKTRWHDLAL